MMRGMKKISLSLILISVFMFVIFISSQASAEPTATPTSLKFNADKTQILGTISGEVGTQILYKRSISKYLGHAKDFNEERTRGWYFVYKPSARAIDMGVLSKYYSFFVGSSDDDLIWERAANISMVNVAPVVSPPSSPDDPAGGGGGGGDASGSSGTTTPPEPEYEGATGEEHGLLSTPTWKTIFGGQQVSTYEEWIGLVWNWTMLTLIPLSTLILIGAGVIYMTSEGDSNRIALAKKLIIGVFSGIGILILGRVLIYFILGDTGIDNWWIT